MSFNPNLASPIDRLRLRLGDTDEDEEDFSDNTYLAFLTLHGNNERAALLSLVEGLIALYSRRVKSEQAGTVKIDYGDRMTTLEAVRMSILAEAQGAPIGSFTDPDADDCDVERRMFTLRMDF